MGANKVLAFSYGAISCTLEDLDDCFGALMVIAEHCRERTAEDPSFGEEPERLEGRLRQAISDILPGCTVSEHPDDIGTSLRVSGSMRPSAMRNVSPKGSAEATSAATTEPPASGSARSQDPDAEVTGTAPDAADEIAAGTGLSENSESPRSAGKETLAEKLARIRASVTPPRDGVGPRDGQGGAIAGETACTPHSDETEATEAATGTSIHIDASDTETAATTENHLPAAATPAGEIRPEGDPAFSTTSAEDPEGADRGSEEDEDGDGAAPASQERPSLRLKRDDAPNSLRIALSVRADGTGRAATRAEVPEQEPSVGAPGTDRSGDASGNRGDEWHDDAGTRDSNAQSETDALAEAAHLESLADAAARETDHLAEDAEETAGITTASGGAEQTRTRRFGQDEMGAGSAMPEEADPDGAPNIIRSETSGDGAGQGGDSIESRASPGRILPRRISSRELNETRGNQVDRLMDETNSKLAGPELRRRRSAIEHLKAAFAATRAEDKPSHGPVSLVDSPYRNDLEQADHARPVADRQRSGPAPNDLERTDLRKGSAGKPQTLSTTGGSDGQLIPSGPGDTSSDEGLPHADLTQESGKSSTPRSPRIAPLVLFSDPTERAGENDAASVLRPRKLNIPTADKPIEDESRTAEDVPGSGEPGTGTGSSGREAALPGLAAPATFKSFVRDMGAETPEEILECAAAYASRFEGRQNFSHPQIMEIVQRLEGQEDLHREDSLRIFGKLLRDGRFSRTDQGRFALSQESRFSSASQAASR